MNAPPLTVKRREAAVSMRRQKSSLLRKHWLTAAFVFLLIGAASYLGFQFYLVELRLHDARTTRAELETKVRAVQTVNERTEAEIARVSDDHYRELMAKSLGFVHSYETVYQSTVR
jgi:cell division protein FtsB